MSFRDESYYEQTFTGLSLNGEVVQKKTFEECIFEDCRFLNCSFEKSRFVSCIFRGCLISAANLLNCRFDRPVFRKCKVIGIDWTRTLLIKEPEFYDCQIDFSNFSMLKIPGAKIVNCEAKEVEFVETDFTDAVFTGTDFEKSRFFKANLSCADFRGAKNYNIDVTNNIIKKAKFSYPEAISLLNNLDIVIE
jgi:fluoroquinolone resistance protein